MAEPVWQFRPRVLPVMTTVMGVSLVAVFTVVAVRLPESSQRTFTLFQQLTLLAFAGAVLWILYRMATLRVAAYDDGLAVRNVFRSYRLPWDRVKVLRFASGDPWLQLFDAENNRLGILAVQAADGPRANRAATALASVAKAHGAG